MDSSFVNGLRITSLEDEDEEETMEPIETDGEAEEEDDAEELDEDEEVVNLGVVEKPKNHHSLARQLFPSKAGGVPAWLDPVNLPPAKARTCGFCGEPLQFLLQIYAPLHNESAFHRMLYVFMCPSMRCLLKDQHEQWKRNEENPCRSVKVFRCQLTRSNSFYSSEPPRRDGSDKPLSGGAALCCWCGTWLGEKICSRCKKVRYCSEKHQALHWQSGHMSDCCQLATSSEASVSTAVNGRGKEPFKAACKTLWLEYEIGIEEECSFSTDPTEDATCATSLVPVKSSADESFQSLSDNFEADYEKKNWASFQQRIAKVPNQVLRYCRDLAAKPLWPLLTGHPSKADIPKCNCCKGPLGYEFQIMPQLLYYFGVRNDPNSLDWATIVVFTCSASCESSVSYKEEFAWVQLYPTTTIP